MAIQRVVAVAGSSGSGKSTAAAGGGLDVLALDAFYRDARTPGLPRWAGDVDWEHPGSFDLDAAAAALRELLATGSATVTAHDLVTSLDQPPRRLEVAGPCLVVEGVMATAVLAAAMPLPVPAARYVLRRPRLLNAWDRVRRDVVVRRRGVLRAALRSWRVLTQERALVADAVAAGARPLGRRELRRALAGELARCAAGPAARGQGAPRRSGTNAWVCDGGTAGENSQPCAR